MLGVISENYEIRIEKEFLELLKNPESVCISTINGEIFIYSEAKHIGNEDRVYDIQTINSGIVKLPEDLVLEANIDIGTEISITVEKIYLGNGNFRLKIRKKLN